MGLPSSKGQGPAYIAPPNECGPSDQTDLNRTVFLNPLGRWSIIHEAGPDWTRHLGGRPRGFKHILKPRHHQYVSSKSYLYYEIQSVYHKTLRS